MQGSLKKTEFYILLASPESAASPWVRDELKYWLENRGCEQFLIVLTSGEIVWAKGDHDFDWTKTTALNHEALSGKFPEEPLWVDCSWARDLDELSIKRHDRFADAVATLASPLHGRSKSELFGEDLRQHRRQMRLAQVAVASLAVLLMVALGFWWQSHVRGNALAVSLGKEKVARGDAERNALIADSRRLAALSANPSRRSTQGSYSRSKPSGPTARRRPAKVWTRRRKVFRGSRGFFLRIFIRPNPSGSTSGMSPLAPTPA